MYLCCVCVVGMGMSFSDVRVTCMVPQLGVSLGVCGPSQDLFCSGVVGGALSLALLRMSYCGALSCALLRMSSC